MSSGIMGVLSYGIGTICGFALPGMLVFYPKARREAGQSVAAPA